MIMAFRSFHSSGDGSQDATEGIVTNIVRDAEVAGREMLGDHGGRRWTELLSRPPDGQSFRMLREGRGIESRCALAEALTNVAYVHARMAKGAGAGSAYTIAPGRDADGQRLGASAHGEGARPTNSKLGSFVELGSSVSGFGAPDVLNARACTNHGVEAEHEGGNAQGQCTAWAEGKTSALHGQRAHKHGSRAAAQDKSPKQQQKAGHQGTSTRQVIRAAAFSELLGGTECDHGTKEENPLASKEPESGGTDGQTRGTRCHTGGNRCQTGGTEGQTKTTGTQFSG
jgi:hypothetical protein